jgi:long-chain acyl-CoA synthetase
MHERVTDALAMHARARPHDLALVDGATRWDWRTATDLVEDLARSLKDQGLSPGDRVALRAPDGAPAWAALLAVIHAGGVHIPVDHTLAAGEELVLIAALRPPWIIRLGRDAAPTDVRLVATGHAPTPDPLGPGASAFVRLSSGTTGAAKGVLLSHATILARIAAANDGLRIGPRDRVLWLLPMAYHVAVSILLYVRAGAALVFGNHLRASVTAEIARANAVTIAYGSPYHVRRLADLPAGADLPASLGRMVSTTTALDATAAADFRARHAIGVRQALGIIEVGLPFVSDGAVGELPGELGSPLPAYRVEIVDQRGDPVPVGATGELAIAGPGLFDAYLEPWCPRDRMLIDGRFRTGDLAVRDAAGRVRLLGRCKEVINVGGVKVFPLEVESVLDAHPLVAASRVRAVADARMGEQVHAEVELAAGADRESAIPELTAWCAERLAPLKRPAAYTICVALARTASGKVKRST